MPLRLESLVDGVETREAHKCATYPPKTENIECHFDPPAGGENSVEATNCKLSAGAWPGRTFQHPSAQGIWGGKDLETSGVGEGERGKVEGER